MKKCDFCSVVFGAGVGRWLYDTKTAGVVMVGEVELSHSDAGWMACDSCHEHIVKGNRVRLARCSVEGWSEETVRELGVHRSVLIRMVLAQQAQAFWVPWAASANFGAPVRLFD